MRWHSFILIIIFWIIGISSCSSYVMPDHNSLKSDQYDKVHIIAHRGFWRESSSKLATNSIASLLAAQEYNLWGCEFDVQITKDSIPIIFHDYEINGLTFLDNSFSAFADIKLPNGEIIPTLDSYLSAVDKDKDLVLVMELKNQGSEENNKLLIDKCLLLLNKYSLLSPERVVFISFSDFICETLINLLPGFSVQALFYNKSLSSLVEMGLHGIDYYQDILLKDPSVIKTAHELGLEVNVWTVNNVEKMNSLLLYGVDYITTDDPMTLRKLMSGMIKSY